MSNALSTAFGIVFDGLAYAMVLYLAAVGLSVTMGLMGFVNLAHGAFAMAGGYALVFLMNRLGVPFLAALPVAFVAVAILSVVLERLLYRRFYRAAELDQVMFTIGLVFISIALVSFAFGSLAQPVRLPAWLTGQVDLGIRQVPAYRAFLIAAGAVLIVLLWVGLERTRFGARVRAAVDNRRMAQSLGVNVDRLFAATFALGGGLAGLGGALGADILAPQPTYALEYMVFFLMVVALGGLGSVKGAFVAALVIGIVDTLGKYFLPQAGALVVYLTMITLLLARPQGLLGRA